MAATYSVFVAQFPEFAAADPTMVNAFLNAAILEVDTSACGTLSDQITYYTAAQAITLSPSGNSSKLKSDGTTVYDAKLAMLKMRAVGSGPRAI